MQTTTRHTFGPGCLTAAERHKHTYTVHRFGARRCSCGSRRWVITCGGPLPASVTCEACSKQNYAATAYECGRADVHHA